MSASADGALSRPDGAPDWLVARLGRLGWAPALERAGDVIARATTPLGGPLAEALGGGWFGHALHPLLTDFPLGAWTGSGPRFPREPHPRRRRRPRRPGREPPDLRVPGPQHPPPRRNGPGVVRVTRTEPLLLDDETRKQLLHHVEARAIREVAGAA